jgi:hypothetical protein
MSDFSKEIFIARLRGLNVESIAVNLANEGVLAPLSELIDNQLGGMTESGKSVGDLKSVKLHV